MRLRAAEERNAGLLYRRRLAAVSRRWSALSWHGSEALAVKATRTGVPAHLASAGYVVSVVPVD
jgi:hypothetical protein